MLDSFEDARHLARVVRYVGEREQTGEAGATRVDADKVWSGLSGNALEVVPELIPGVARVLGRARERLMLPAGGIRGFIYPGADLQASCLAIDDTSCALRLSAGLIEKLDADELAFVVGHELGHFLLGHGTERRRETQSIEYFALSRAREISCDRVGLISSGEIDPALRAIIKTTSGLDARHLRFDTAVFLRSALKDIESHSDPTLVFSTHPNMPVRARCLLWFSQFVSDHYPAFSTTGARTDFDRVDERVHRDMIRYVEKPALEYIDTAKKHAASWIWLGAAVTDHSLSQQEQAQLARRFGADFVDKVRRNLDGLAISEVIHFVRDRAQDEIRHLVRMAPASGAQYVEEQLRESEAVFLSDGKSNIARQG
jgi:hypothetical protein